MKSRENNSCLLGGCLFVYNHHLCVLEWDAEPQVIPEGLCLSVITVSHFGDII